MTQTLTDHDSIKRWAIEHGATPARVKGTRRGDEATALRFEFEMEATSHDSRLERLDWDDWFKRFDEGGLALMVDDGAEAPNSSQLVRRGPVAASKSAPKRAVKPADKVAREADDDDDLFDDTDDEVDDFDDDEENR